MYQAEAQINEKRDNYPRPEGRACTRNLAWRQRLPGRDGLHAWQRLGLWLAGANWLPRGSCGGLRRRTSPTGEQELDGLDGLAPFKRGQHFWWQGLGGLGHGREADECKVLRLCALTFELRRERRDGAWPARRMIRPSASRAKCHAGASRLQRRVRPRALDMNELFLEAAGRSLNYRPEFVFQARSGVGIHPSSVNR